MISRVRDGLGLGHGAYPPSSRRRFVRDGAVAVEVVRPKSETETRLKVEVAELRATVAAEREARALAERALMEAQQKIHTLQTRLVHAEMAQAERMAPAAPPAPEPSPVAESEPIAEPEFVAEPESVEEPRPRRRRRGAAPDATPDAAPAREPKPVRWWTASYRSRGKRAQAT